MTERDQWMLIRIMRRGRQLSAESTATLAQEQCVESFMELVSMVELLHPSHTSASAMQNIRCSGVKHTASGL